tara:strand:+ start:169 stop:303 length:135 start_codon:yes stop_codon:yes gene_type:complete
MIPPPEGFFILCKPLSVGSAAILFIKKGIDIFVITKVNIPGSIK